MSRPTPIPYFPVPPRDYNTQYFAEVVRAFSVYTQQMANPGPWLATTMTLTNLQTDDVGLEPGALFQQGGFVKVTLTDMPHVRGSSATGSVGAVTVTT